MKYLEKSFTIGPPSKVFGCEACIYGQSSHGPLRRHTCGRGEAVFIEQADTFTEEDLKRGVRSPRELFRRIERGR